MSRTRIVKGNITKVIGGNYKRYSKDNIENIGSKVIQIGKEEGVSYGINEEPPELDIKPKKIKFRPKKISPKTNIISVIEKIDEKLLSTDNIFIGGKLIKDNWISVHGKLYLIPNNVSLYGNTFFKVNEELYQSTESITNCKTLQDYQDSLEEQLNILKEFTKDIESSNMKYKQHITDRLSYDGYYRYITCIEEIEFLFSNTKEEENTKIWITKILGN